MRALAAALVVFLFAVPGGGASSSWTELRGDAARSGTAILPDGDLDVVVPAFRLVAEGDLIQDDTSGLMATPSGVVGLSITPAAAGGGRTGTCHLVHLAQPGRPAEILGPAIPCGSGAHLTAYDATQNLLLVCVDGLPSGPAALPGMDPLLRAYDATSGDQAWGYRPASQAAAGGFDDNNDAFCTAGAVRDGVLYVAFSNDIGQSLLQAVRLSDQVALWSTAISPVDGNGALPADPILGAEAAAHFLPLVVTLTGTGLAVSGQMSTLGSDFPGQRATGLGGSPAYAWFTFNGTFVGMRDATGLAGLDQSGLSDLDGSPTLSGSYAMAAHGDLAAGVLGDHLFILNPALRYGIDAPIPGPSGGIALQLPPAWSGTTLLVPYGNAAYLFDGDNPGRPPRVWSGYQGAIIGEAVLDQGGDGYVVAQSATPAGAQAQVFRIDGGHARATQRLPVEGLGLAGNQQAQLFPMPDGSGLLVWTSGGMGSLLGVAAEEDRPSVAPSNLSPALHEDVELDVGLPTGGGEARILVAWGDGTLQEWPAGPVAGIHHTYLDASGDVPVRVTALHADGTSATRLVHLHVGQVPPEANFLVQAFAPENQNLTFGVLGIALTLLGAVIALLSRGRQRSRMSRGLAALERLREKGRSEPLQAATALAGLRARFRAEVSDGRLTDSQFSALELSGRDLLHGLRQRILGPLAGRVSGEFQALLDGILQDGRVSPSEASRLRRALRRERSLSTAERLQLARLLAG